MKIDVSYTRQLMKTLGVSFLSPVHLRDGRLVFVNSKNC